MLESAAGGGSAPGGVVSAPRGGSAPGGCLLPGGSGRGGVMSGLGGWVCSRGVYPSMH